VGDLLTKPPASGGFGLGRIISSAILAIFIIALIQFTPQRAGRHPGESEATT
jgi:uncharacterized membrane-anchored protein